MTSTWSRSVQMTLCAAAICALGAVQAQETPRPLSATTTNAQTATQPAATGTSAAQAQMPSQAAPSQARSAEGQKMQRASKGERHQGQRGKYANPQQHEAAAVRAEERAGRMPRGQDMDQYQRNALARCDVFRNADDRRSCAERVRSGESSGSVRDGGMLREYTEQVPVRP